MPRVNYKPLSEFTKAGLYAKVRRELPPARNFLCKDCGNNAEEYDHYNGLDAENWDKVEPVCIPCHGKREAFRGNRKGYRKDYIGPRLKQGNFFSKTERNRKSHRRSFRAKI